MSKQLKAEHETEVPMPGEPWGKRLRDIRESRGITLEAVASELRLEVKLLQQIESEDLNQLPSAPFVKGYLRSYARMLDVDSAPILAAYGQVCGPDAPGLTNVSRIKELTSKDTAPRSTTWIIVAVLVISVLIWWWSQILTFKKNAEDNTAPQAVPELPAEQQEVAPTPAPEAVAPESANGEAVIELPLPQPAAPVQPPQPTVAPGATSAPAATGGVAPAAPAADTITLKFSGESWVEIIDATGARLFADMGKVGASRTVTGHPPFSVMLGNAPAVTVEYNGVPYDHKAYAKKGIARFTLGSAD